MDRNQDGFTLIELLVVLVVMGTLLAIAVPSYLGARVRTNDAAAQSNIAVAAPAFEAYYADNGTYVGMTLATLQSTYSPGIQNIRVIAARASDYCVSSTVSRRRWYKLGPDGSITTTRCR
jgi:type IV pilus assembly protein PilA